VQAIIFSDGGTEEELQALSAMPFLATLESHCHDALRQSPLIPSPQPLATKSGSQFVSIAA
jgi:hypothetical protein